MEAPIIVCGNPRSGTRFVANLLNSHHDIAITDELHRHIALDIYHFVKKLDDYIASELWRQSLWPQRKPRFVRDIMFELSHEGVFKKKHTCKRFGNKTPGAEFLLEQHIDLFGGMLPQYIYCLREGRKVFRSLKNMPWSKNSVQKNLELYKKSVGMMEKILAMYPDSITVVQLDLVGPKIEERLAVAHCIFEFIGETISEEVLQFVKEWKVAQPVHKIVPESDVADLEEDEIRLLEADSEYTAICKKYGYA